MKSKKTLIQKSKTYYPINLDIQNKKCVVVGGGKVAYRKIKSLLKYGAKIYLVSPKIIEEIKPFLKNSRIKYSRENYSAKHLQGAVLVIAAVNDSKINRKIFGDAEKKNILVNVVDDPHFCRFIVPASFQRGPINISISTSGASPALAKKIRFDLQKIISKKYTKLLKTVRELRKEFKKKFDRKKRQEIWKKFFGINLQNLLKSKNLKALKRNLSFRLVR